MERPLRIAYLDLAFSTEQYGLQPTRYGGGGVVARYLKEDPEVDFHVFAPMAAFDNVGRTERMDRCHPLPEEVLAPMRAFAPIPFSFEANWGWTPDIILHPHTCHTINVGPKGHRPRAPVVHFCGFDGSAGHAWNDYVLFYDDSFVPRFGERAKYVRIGKPTPPTFTPHPKAPYVFQCSRHDDHMNSAETARQCLRYGIPGYFAGPIHNGYGLMEHIDGKLTHYLGEIDEATKLAYYRHARLMALPHAWPEMPFNQTVIEAQGQGCPIWATKRGPFLSRYLRDGVNGFDSAEVDLSIAYHLALRYENEMAQASWTAARAYDVSVMCQTFKQAFREIVDEWRA